MSYQLRAWMSQGHDHDPRKQGNQGKAAAVKERMLRRQPDKAGEQPHQCEYSGNVEQQAEPAFGHRGSAAGRPNHSQRCAKQ